MSVLKCAPLAAIIRQLQKRKKKIVFTNGCFDLMHIGHLRLLERCKKFGDYLVVGINSDRSVREIKGSGRPIQTEKDRAALCDGLKPVDYVVIFDEPTPGRIISILKPDVLVKGGDWKLNEIVGRESVKTVKRVPLVKGKSTTAIIERIQRGVRPHKEEGGHTSFGGMSPSI